MAKNKTMINIHAKLYIQEVFETRLREAGFECPDDKLLCWYRVKNQEVLNTLIFCSSWTQLPLFLDIGYEFVPLFTEPVYIRNVNFNGSTHFRNDCFRRIGNFEGGTFKTANLMPYSSEIQILAPGHGGRGIYTFNEVLLPMFEQTVTIEDCYAAHKQFHLNNDTRFGGALFGDASREFIDEAVYLDDSEVYPYCKARIEKATRLYTTLIKKKPNDNSLQEMLNHWNQLKTALFDGGREEYLGILELRKERNSAKLRKKFGITF